MPTRRRRGGVVGWQYILPVKDNQGTLAGDMALLFDGFEAENYVDAHFDTAKAVSEGHGRREIRQCWVVAEEDYRSCLRRANDWPHLTSLVKLLTIRQTGDGIEITTRYFISSWSASAQVFLHTVQCASRQMPCSSIFYRISKGQYHL